jgi:hypothetical protein
MPFTSLSLWGREPLPIVFKFDPTVDMTTPPLDQVNKMPVGEYFMYAAELKKLNRPHLTDWSILAHLQRIGLEPGKSFAFEKLDPAVKRVQ